MSSSISIAAQPQYDIWAFGLILYEVIKGKPLSMYAEKGPLQNPNMVKIGKWNDRSLKKSLKGIKENSAVYDLLIKLLQADPMKRLASMREVLEHPFFGRVSNHEKSESKSITSKAHDRQDMQNGHQLLKSLIESCKN